MPAYRNPAPAVDYTAYAQQQEANRQADIAARNAAAQRLADQKAELATAKIKSESEADAMRRAATFNALTTRTNSDWNVLKAKLEAKNKPSKIKVTEKDANTGTTTTRELTPDEFAAEKKAKQIEDLTAKRDSLKSSWIFPGLRGIPARIADTEKQIQDLQAPSDLVTAGAAPVAATVVAPTPRGFIGSPGANTFLAGPTPLGLNRAQTNEFAINLNNGGAQPPRDLLRSTSFPSGYQPGHGAMQVDAAPPASPMNIQDAPMAPYKEQVIPKTHIAHLLANPDEKTAADFDAKYGEGASDAYLREQP